MNEFQNKLIVKEETYQNGFFPKVPQSGKIGRAVLLTGGIDSDIIVDDYTTARQIRQGKYNQLVEISTAPYLKEIRFYSPSKETHYCFDVYVKAVIQVNDPITFYENRNIDVDAYFDNLFSLDVKKITRRYSILDYDGMDDELTRRLSSYNTVDPSTGFSYQISAVDATPGEKAQEYVQKYGKQQLEAELKKNARKLAESYANSYEEAIRTEVAEGKLSEAEGILKIREYKKDNYEEQVNHLDELVEKGYIVDAEARSFVKNALDTIGVNRLEQTEEEQKSRIEDSAIDNFYVGEEE